MIRISFRITWPALFLIALALIAWLLRRSSQAQTRPVTRPIHQAQIITMPGDGAQLGHETADSFVHETTETIRTNHRKPNEFDRARARFDQRGECRAR